MCPNSFTKAFIFDQEEWDEIRRREGKEAGEPYKVPEHGVVSIRFPEKYKNMEIVVLAVRPKEVGEVN